MSLPLDIEDCRAHRFDLARARPRNEGVGFPYGPLPQGMSVPQLVELHKLMGRKDQGNDKDYSHDGFTFTFKKMQADLVPKIMSSKEVKYFKVSRSDHRADMLLIEMHQGDEDATKETVRKYESGTADAPKSTVA